MIIYTPMPLELVFEGMDQPSIPLQELDYGDTKLLVEPVGLNQGKVVRLISTQPMDYLNPQYQPGTIVNLVGKC